MDFQDYKDKGYHKDPFVYAYITTHNNKKKI